MYRFNLIKPNGAIVLFGRFKYNKCIGSMKLVKRVEVTRDRFKYNKCIGSIENIKAQAWWLFAFKYNKCIGSIQHNITVSFCSKI